MAIPSAYPRTHDEAALFEPYTYICSNPGKEIRTQLIEAFNIWIKVPPEELAIITKVVKMLHTSSLLIDDIEDDSILRRGEPVAHKIFGVPATINCANYVYFLALAELTKIPNPKMLTIFTEELLCLHRGQGMELLWRDTLTCPTEEEFIAMVNDKTGGLLRLAVKLMQAASNCQVDYVPMVELIGIHFQIRDDYLNLQSNQYTANKGFCEDLTEGKFSFPIIHSIRADKNNRQLLNILKQKPTTPELKVYALNLMHKTRTFEYCREKMRFYEAKAREEIRRLGGNSRLEKIIDCLSIPDLTIDAAKDAPIVVAP
ncbi:geranylgeranyl pyrophosphate synthase [Lobosporangium transversale]|uniref:Geranylgeranyl pyrophosphate synthase n=1 Tax=Lobosporangium transversale TaxID=64571 RepID=A0A1Y2GBX4_9FUNG|nr:geranylgeranyl pyrophosphate synthase [Lobosporangium transversale]ORZ01868.1 geranylgeranyl pyrophosphate synthase [Lobosporangium transversale]|eukprot:XP_021876165.1 geranylgeranyl pyrophosphate synthase [Lobosporangium transversale]